MQSDGDDLYALLEVHPKASPEVIKKAYHTLMQKNHPDRGGDVQVAQRINQAYDVLIDRDARQRYDQQQLRRRTLLSQLENRKQQEKAKVERQQRDAAAAAPAELKNLQGEYRSPMLWGSTVLVADERGNRVVLLDRKGGEVWRYGKRKGETLVRPKLAQFTPEGEILIADCGQQRLLRVNLAKELRWEYSYAQGSPQARATAEPVFVQPLPEGGALLTDAGHRRIYELDASGKTVWEFGGKLGGLLPFTASPLRAEGFLPVSAFRLENGCYLIADRGNGRILELDRKCKLRWMYPDKKHAPLQAINFAYRLPSGSTWITSDKIIEISLKGEVLWHYARLDDADIKQAYPLPDSAFVMDFAHLVKRGINQEVMVLDHNSKILYRHYYSQHRFL